MTVPSAEQRPAGPVVLDLRNITLRFGGVTAIRDISFDVRQGEIRAIIGPNGAGKSSMLNVIPGFYVPSRARSCSRAARARRCAPARSPGPSRTSRFSTG